ncbi:MAG TPA: 30S ribosomal protein S4 [Persephonella sp.]|uniref:Small ribosomal subunit protein uS4 n=1 Tax=Persephonella marina (strain DSM 14350 / EX-H1) TaxID=123214 RepID=RS4_PERMH|nr:MULTISPECIES: 30S ribosomal protein S4 [Persephonella]C0QQQ0.1 RecName: Full=Small ribosomal subunit protein uS4; AltName: Full=30S ribosomal protein S4 [Persephonella marina EX-H1]ACO03188.1 ribosomal protein S4 [Persephonella marina EX-H1]HCB68747.1 30S ribosomal protein S4 [Persephonella sp.]
MGRYLGPLTKVSRRLGVFVGGSLKAFQKRNFPPGQHGRVQGRKVKLSDYAIRLQEKQKLRYLYGGIREKQFKRYFDEAARSAGNTGQILLQLLERRLDNVVYRLGFAKTRRQARQLVRHGHFLVNGRKVDIPSYRVDPGDIIELREKSRNSPLFKENLESRDPRSIPNWLELDKENFRGKVLEIPQEIELEIPVNVQLIIEFYSM